MIVHIREREREERSNYYCGFYSNSLVAESEKKRRAMAKVYSKTNSFI